MEPIETLSRDEAVTISNAYSARLSKAWRNDEVLQDNYNIKTREMLQSISPQEQLIIFIYLLSEQIITCLEQQNELMGGWTEEDANCLLSQVVKDLCIWTRCELRCGFVWDSEE
jgi:hypothetical protein